ncbi:MAG: hypothetical protein QGD94_06395, partial [Planctomycetia bacterium]|nr:hypothetical protein [Planctomycetia bacterium]
MPSEVVTWDMIAALGRVVIYMAGVAAIVGMLWALWRGWKNKRDSKRRWLGWVDYLHHSVERPSTPRYRASGECDRCEELQAESIRAAVQVGFDEGRRKGVARCHGPQPLLSDPWGMKAFRATCEQVRREEMDGHKTVTASKGYEFKITGLDGHPQTTREYREDARGNVSFDALPHAELARPDIELVEIPEPDKAPPPPICLRD